MKCEACNNYVLYLVAHDLTKICVSQHNEFCSQPTSELEHIKIMYVNLPPVDVLVEEFLWTKP